MGELSHVRHGVIAILLLTAACARPATTSQASSPPPVPADAQTICANFVTTALSVDATTDHGPADARQRATRAFGDPATVGTAGGEGRDPDWSLLVEHGAHVTVSIRPVADDPPPARGDQAAAGVEVTRIAAGRAGWHTRLPDAVAYCSLRRTTAGWKVTALTLSDNGSTGETP